MKAYAQKNRAAAILAVAGLLATAVPGAGSDACMCPPECLASQSDDQCSAGQSVENPNCCADAAEAQVPARTTPVERETGNTASASSSASTLQNQNVEAPAAPCLIRQAPGRGTNGPPTLARHICTTVLRT